MMQLVASTLKMEAVLSFEDVSELVREERTARPSDPAQCAYTTSRKPICDVKIAVDIARIPIVNLTTLSSSRQLASNSSIMNTKGFGRKLS
jgi:hypothetical protein